jgi:hypothetical protein
MRLASMTNSAMRCRAASYRKEGIRDSKGVASPLASGGITMFRAEVEGIFRQGGPRRTPRKSFIVVLPENHVVSPDVVAERLSGEKDSDQIDVILACAGQPTSIAALQRRVRDLQVLLAPPGTSGEDLRELAMNQAPGDIVTLLSGTPA